MDQRKRYTAPPSASESLSMILVMGITGSGKSYFINKLAGRDVVVESAALDSCTAVCQGVPVNIGSDKVLLIDTPGFDDSQRSDTEILTEISRLLAGQYRLGVILKGVIYLHRISDPKFQGHSVKTLEIFKKICGVENLKNVILATSRWSDIDEPTGASREGRLREHFWKFMLDHGSTMTRYYGNRESGVAIVSQLLGSANVVLDIQRELVDEGKSLDQTSAGAFVDENLTKLRAEHERQMAELATLKRQLQHHETEKRYEAQQNYNREQVRLRQAEADKEKLRRDVAREVREEIELEIARKEKKSKSSGLGRVLPFLPTVLSVLGMFIGIPPGSTGLLTSWFSDLGLSDSISSFFDSF